VSRHSQSKWIIALPSIDWSRPDIADAIIITAALSGILVAAISFDVPSILLRFAADHPEKKLDDLLVALVILGAALLIYGHRRREELAGEIELARSAQERLSRKNRELDAAVDHMPQGLVMYDRSARFVMCNKRYAEMYGLPPEMMTPGHSFESIVAYRIKAAGLKMDPHQTAKEIEATVRAGKRWQAVWEFADGRSIDIMTTPLRNGGWVATHEDITERRRAERHLRRTETLLISVIENVPAVITMKDTRSLKYVFVNKAGEKYFGMPRSQMVGCAAHDLFDREAADLIASADREVLQSGRELFAREYRVNGPDGRQRLVNERRLPIKDDKGDLQCLLSVIADVTDVKWTDST
jgi:PAS domain S-box-containing protein